MKQNRHIPLGVYPTPLYKLEQLSRQLHKDIYIKRDDMCGLALGGNKVRKLEYLLADAVNRGCDTVITTGGLQSNHAMLTAACAKKLGLDAVLLLMGPETEIKGNLLLDKLFGAQLIFSEAPHDQIGAEMEWVAAGLRGEGKRPYIIPLGGSNPLGCMGYVSCMREIAAQTAELGLDLSHIVCANGSGGTYAGAYLGARALLPDTRVTGVDVGAVEQPEQTLLALMQAAAGYMGLDFAITAADIHCHPFQGPGYALASAEGVAAMRLLAQSEGILLDPVYTGKAFAGMLELLQGGYFDHDDNILFLHTGGAAALFAILMEDI